MTNHATDASLNKTARIAGLMFLCTLIIPALNWIFILSKFIAAENPINTAHNILANEFQFRISIINELITSAVIVILALALYVILKEINKNFALLALFLKLIESILTAVIALGHFIALLILNGQASLTVFDPEQVQALAGLFLNAYISLTAIPGVFVGLNLMLFSYLLFKSKYVPRMLAAFGVLSYALVFVYDSLTILMPTYASIMIIQIICSAPICIFQLIIGIWLLFKGVKAQPQNNNVLESAGKRSF
jgi:hypothetical protein